MNEKKIYTEQEAKEYAESVSNTLFIREYNDGNSEDTERQATPQEKIRQGFLNFNVVGKPILLTAATELTN